jgi:hypothetical protein
VATPTPAFGDTRSIADGERPRPEGVERLPSIPLRAKIAKENESSVLLMVNRDSRHKRMRQIIRLTCLLAVIGFTSALPPRGAASSETGSILPVSDALCDEMKNHHVIGLNAPVGCDRLRLLKFAYVDFAGQLHPDGEMVVMDAAAPHVLRIFASLRWMHFPIAKVRLLNHYEGSDDASMRDNNTSAFNDRQIVGRAAISLHAYALAIDLNPIQNPFVTRSGTDYTYNPAAGVEYANRLPIRPWKARRTGMAEDVVEIFAENGFLIWGGYWDTPLDYQHFQVGRQLAERLVRLPPREATAEFNRIVERYRRCRRGSARMHAPTRAACVMIADPDSRET